MPFIYKVLGQSAPSATTNTNVYTVPVGSQVVISSIVVTNRAASATSFRIAVRPDGAALANQHYIMYDAPIAANDAVALSLGITAHDTDIVTVFAGNANLTFSLFGSEIT
jgi:hypothetical protein